MVFVDSISELEYFTPNPVWGCYSDAVFAPNDILLQVNDIGSAGFYGITITVCKPDGSGLEDATAYFDVFFASYTLNGVTKFYCNIRCDNYSPAMLANRCFVLNVNISNSSTGATIFNKYTQKYNIINAAVFATGITVFEGRPSNIARLCGTPVVDNTCGKPYIKFVAQFDCIDTFTGDYYGDGTVIAGFGRYPFPFVRLSWLQARLKTVPKTVKRTISINCRTQRTETTAKMQLQGIIPFPVWKMVELENMLLSNHLFLDGKEYQSEGGTPFKQFGKPQACNYVYQMDLDIQECYEWQIFGCTAACESQTYYYPITF